MVELFEEDGTRRAALSRPSQNGIRLLDGRRRIAGAQPGLSPRCADAGRFLLNRYWDVATRRATVGWRCRELQNSGRPPNEVYRKFARRGGVRLGLIFFTLATRCGPVRPALQYDSLSLSI